MTQVLALPLPISRWQRFIDKLAGGPPNLEKLHKLKGRWWFVRYNVSLVMLLTSLAVGVVPELVDRLNGIPDPTALQTLQVRIVRTHLTEPHLFVELPDGSQRGMEWPVRISGGRGGFRSYVWTEEEREHLPGCLAIVRGVPLRWTINDRFRVWELDCPARGIRIGLEKTSWDHMTPWDLEVFLFVLFSGVHLFIGVIYLREKRGNL